MRATVLILLIDCHTLNQRSEWFRVHVICDLLLLRSGISIVVVQPYGSTTTFPGLGTIVGMTFWRKEMLKLLSFLFPCCKKDICHRLLSHQELY